MGHGWTNNEPKKKPLYYFVQNFQWQVYLCKVNWWFFPFVLVAYAGVLLSFKAILFYFLFHIIHEFDRFMYTKDEPKKQGLSS